MAQFLLNLTSGHGPTPTVSWLYVFIPLSESFPLLHLQLNTYLLIFSFYPIYAFPQGTILQQFIPLSSSALSLWGMAQ